ncbi:DUF4920 domain-containing protein [Kriegella aquimaris]|uniref:DUF4920 domain-containing protein n=1 Tax=Kriegella aquimaris TaxID=192904 RepID=A0A1G9XKP6_9FLAO|nr:DUF4920 domain-containing protein [Kriegella aquimaris]SDM96765.1 protein of unknown function [Kriegella aquimaris]
MRDFTIFLLVLLIFFSCVGQETKKALNSVSNITGNFSSFGEKIQADAYVSSVVMSEKYASLAINDTVASKFYGQVIDVCQAKGCWMRLQLNDSSTTMVRFKDYGFFMPKDIAGKTVIVNGLAFVEEMTVADQQHYATDAGKSKEEIAQITESKKMYGFEANGVLLKK